MRVEIHETTLRKYSENRELIDEKINETYVIYPAAGKMLRNKLTGVTTKSFIGLSSKSDILNYEEV